MAEHASARRVTSSAFLGLHLTIFLVAAVAWLLLVVITWSVAPGLDGSPGAASALLLGPLVAWGILLFLHVAIVVSRAALGGAVARAIGGAIALLVLPVSVVVAFVWVSSVFAPDTGFSPREASAVLPEPWLLPRVLLGGSIFLWPLLIVGTAIAVFALAVNGKERMVAEQTSDRPKDGERDEECGFRQHLAVYLTFALFFFILNLLTGPSDLWFYWPVLGWGLAIALHAVGVYGLEAPVKLLQLIQSVAARIGAMTPAPPAAAGPAPATPAHPSPTQHDPPGADSLTAALREGEARVDAMRARARRIQKPAVRDQALRLCASADQILAVLAEDPDQNQLARDFVTRYLTPAEAIVSRYARLASRDVPSAAPTLAKVETEDLPLLEQKMTSLYDRLHRGDLIDLEVAREMLAFDFPTVPTVPGASAAAGAGTNSRGESAESFSGLPPRR